MIFTFNRQKTLHLIEPLLNKTDTKTNRERIIVRTEIYDYIKKVSKLKKKTVASITDEAYMLWLILYGFIEDDAFDQEVLQRKYE